MLSFRKKTALLWRVKKKLALQKEESYIRECAFKENLKNDYCSGGVQAPSSVSLYADFGRTLRPVRAEIGARGMAKIYRPFYVEFWDDDKLPFMDDDFQIVFLHVCFNRYTTPIGIYCQSIEGLAAHKNRNGKWPIERYAKSFREGLAKGFWKLDSNLQVILIERWWKPGFNRNRPSNPNIFSGWLKFFDDIPECDLKTQAKQRIITFSEEWGEPFAKVTAKLRQSFAKASANREREREREREKKIKNIPAEIQKPAGFENLAPEQQKAEITKLTQTVAQNLKPERSPKQKANDLDIESVQAAYRQRFGKQIQPSQVMVLLNGRNGKRFNTWQSGLILVEAIKEAPAEVEEPFAYLIQMARNPETVARCEKKAFENV